MRWLATSSLLGVVALAACTYENPPSFRPPISATKGREYTSPEDLALFEAEKDFVYRLGAGDEITVEVWGRDELKGKHIIGPDGFITLPLCGPVKIADLTREAAADAVSTAFARFYIDPSTVIRVEKYQSNRIVVIGRVVHPGVLYFETQPTLLETIARAGGLPVLEESATLSRCSIIRGRNQIVWVDLTKLLSGEHLSMNVRLEFGDVVYIPDASDTQVFVLGEVKTPGAYRLSPEMTLLDALLDAGGPTEDAAIDSIRVLRMREGVRAEIDLHEILDADGSKNYELRNGDVIYVPATGLAKVGYFVKELSPIVNFLLIGYSIVPGAGGS